MDKPNPVGGLMLLTCLLAAATATAQSPDDDSPQPAGESGSASGGEAEADDETEPALEPIIVTGGKVGRTLEASATSVGVVTGVQIEDYGDQDLDDMTERTANVTMSGRGYLSIRGVRLEGAEGSGQGQPVIGTYLDGVAVNSAGLSGNAFDSFDMKQVEIMRGPQSTSLGRNVLAGAVVAESRDPTRYWEGHLRARTAELGHRQYAFAGGGPLGGTTAFRVTANHKKHDGTITNTTLDDDEWAAQEDDLYRAKLEWRPDFAQGLRLLLTGMRSTREGRRPMAVEANADDDDEVRRTITSNEAPGGNNNRSHLLSLQAEYPLSAHAELTAVTGFVDSDRNEHLDYDQSDYDGGVGSYHAEGQNITQEVRVNITDWGRWTGVAGLYGGNFDSGSHSSNRDIRVPLSEFYDAPVIGDLVVARLDQYNDFSNEADNIAAFTEFDYAATERLTLTFGLRYDYEQSEAVNDYAVTRAEVYLAPQSPQDSIDLGDFGLPIDVPLTKDNPVNILPLLGNFGVLPNPGTGGTQTADADYDALLPKAGIRYALTEHWTGFVTYTEAYRAGGAEVVNSTGEINEYDPEFTKTYETGLRAQWPQRGLQLGLNIYYVDWTDQQVQVLTPDGIGFYTENAASSELYGGELELDWRIAPGWNAYASLGLSETEFENYETSSADYSDNEFVQAPETTASIGTRWRSASGWFASGSISHTDEYYLQPDNDPRAESDSRQLLDARLGYEAAHWSAYAYGRNLLDRDYADYRYQYEGTIGYPEPSRIIQYGEPRVVGIQVDAHF